MKNKAIFVLLFGAFFILVHVVQASVTCNNGIVCEACDMDNNCPRADTSMSLNDTPVCTGSNCKLENPLGNVTPQQLIGRVINAVLGIVGSLALAMFIWGGLLWMTAGGAPDRVTKGVETMKWATLGLVVIFTAYALVKFVITSIGG